MERFKNKLKLRLCNLKFFLGMFKEEVTIVTHNMNSSNSDKNSEKVVKSFKEVLEYGKDIAQEGRHINGKLVEYVRTISAFTWEDQFMFIVLYKNI